VSTGQRAWGRVLHVGSQLAWGNQIWLKGNQICMPICLVDN
jgi:hypothetical protein